MAAASISLRGVGHAFGATGALAGVDLDLEPGVTGQAAGRVWLADQPDPADAEHAEPSLEDAYLLLRGGPPQAEPAGEVAS